MDWFSLLFAAEAACFIVMARSINRELDTVRRQEAETFKELMEAEAVAARQRARLKELSDGQI